MKYFSGILLLLIFVFQSCGGDSGKKAHADEKISGKTVYENNCVICHGGDGKLGAAGAKDLSVSSMKSNEVSNKIRQGGNGMTAFQGMLSDEEIDAVTEYVENLRGE